MLELKSKTLARYYSEHPMDYSIKFVHYSIDIEDESNIEYKLLEEDLNNLKRELPSDVFKIYIADIDTLRKIEKNTTIIDNLGEDIYFKIQSIDDLNNLNDKINVIVNKNLLDKNINNNIVLELEDFSDISNSKLDGLLEKYNITNILVGQISYLSSYFKDFLEEKANYFNMNILNIDDYFNVEKRVLISNDIYDVDTYKKIKDELIKLCDDISENDTDYNKFRIIYYNLINKVSYDFVNLDLNKLEDQNLIGGLFNNTCVCEGYSKILKESLGLVGIKSIVVGGNGSKEDGGHLWNQVLIDGNWYNADAASDAIRREKNQDVAFCLVNDCIYDSDSINARVCDKDYKSSYIGK